MEQNRHVEQQRKQIYGHVTIAIFWYLTKMKKHRLEKKQNLQEMILRKLTSTCRKPKWGPYLSPCTKTTWNWSKT